MKMIEQKMATNKNPIHKFLMRFKWYRKMYSKFAISNKGGFPKWIKKTDERKVTNYA